MNNLNLELLKLIKHLKSYGHLLLILTAGALCYYHFILSPHLKQSLATAKYEIVAKGFEEKTEVITAEVEKKREEVEQLRLVQDTIKMAIFDEKEASEFLGGLEGKAEQFKCYVESISFLPVIETGNFFENKEIVIYRATVRMRGTFKDIALYVSSLQNQAKKVWINGLDIEKVNNDSGMLDSDMAIKIYAVSKKERIINVD